MEINSYGREGKYEITEIGRTSLDKIFVDYSETEPHLGLGPAVWIDTYGNALYWDKTDNPTPTTYGWISADDAEQIALAILIAVKKARQEI